MRLLCAAAVSALVVLLSGAPGPVWAEQEPASRGEAVFSIGIPSAGAAPLQEARPLASAAPAATQVQAVWDLGAAGNWRSAGWLLASLEATYPAWRGPADLEAYLRAGRRDQDIRDALAMQDWAAALALIPAAGPADCEPPFQAWSRAEALEGLGDSRELNRFYVRILSNCSDPALVAGMAGRGAAVLDAEGLAAARSIKALRQSSDPGVMIAYERIIRADDWLRFASAVAQGDLEAAAGLAATTGDPRLLEHAGWTFLERDAPRASGYFERALAQGSDTGARRGLVLATLAGGDVASARKAIAGAADPAGFADLSARSDLTEASALREQGDWRSAVALATRATKLDPAIRKEAEEIIGGALLDAAGAAYDTGDFEGARSLAGQAAGYSATARAGSLRAAWSDLQLGRAQEAASVFSRLYLERPDVEAAEGYALAAEKTGGLGTAAALARALGGPLGEKVNARYANTAFNDGDYLTARAYAPDAYAALEGVERIWYRQSISARSQGGTRGENRLRGFVSTTSAGTSRGTSRFEAGVSIYSLDPGSSASPAIAASRETFAAPYAAWSREGDTSLAARIGLLPLGTDAGAVLTGEVAVAHEADGRSVEVRAFARPRTDSVLSFAGQTDASGAEFGRVTELGAQAQVRLPVGKRHSVQADIAAATLDGERTVSNAAVSAGIAGSYSIEREGFAYLVTGPFYQFQTYDRNTNFFTPGHGGYFSPQTFHRAGWSANAQTDLLRSWILKADAAIAYESVEEDPAPANPLFAGAQPLVGGSESSGVAGALDFAFARRVSSDVIVSANLSATASQAYEDFRIGIALTWVPGGRAGLVRTDLPADPFSPGSWIAP